MTTTNASKPNQKQRSAPYFKLGVYFASFISAIGLVWIDPSHASIPPSYEIAVVAENSREEAMNRALLEAMSAQNAFFWVRSKLSPRDLRECLQGEDAKKCVRDAINDRGFSDSVRPVVIMADVEDGITDWHCIGSGKAKPPMGRVNVRIDLRAAILGEGKPHTDNLKAAMDCIYSAANESSPQ